MNITSSYPVLLASDVAETALFFRDFGYEPVFASDWYMSLRSGDHELAVLAVEHESVPAAWRRPAAGVLVNLEVDDVDEVYRRLVVEGDREPVQQLRSEDFGQRHFILAAPDGVLVDVITPIEPSPEFLAQYG